MAKFLQAAFKKDMIKVNESGKDIWYNCDPKAKGFAKTAFKEGDEVDLIIEQREGNPFVTQVRKPGGAVNHSAPAPAPVSNNQVSTAPAPIVKPAWNSGGKSPEESEKITRLSVMSTAANAAQILTGQITDPVVLGDVVVQLYTKFLAEIKK